MTDSRNTSTPLHPDSRSESDRTHISTRPPDAALPNDAPTGECAAREIVGEAAYHVSPDGDDVSPNSSPQSMSGDLTPSDSRTGSSRVGITPAGESHGSSRSGVRVTPVQDKTVISKRPPTTEPAVLPAIITSTELGASLEGTQLGHYLLEAFVGGGGMGAVFRANDTKLNRTVAVKVMSRDRTDEDTLRRFQNEAQSAARLDHPNIARVHYVGEDRGLNYIVFEYIEGVNIRDLVTQRGPLPIDEAINYALQVAEALEHASQRDVVHRDIKPSNVLVMSSGHVKLVDMGLARLHQVEAPNPDLTATGVTLGTFDYISPEQARDPRSADVRSDLYSLGCTLYFMLTGRPPFPDGTVLQKLLSHSSDSPTDARTIRPDIGEELGQILERLLAKQPSQRFQTPSELIGSLLVAADHLGFNQLARSGTVWVATEQGKWDVVERQLPWFIPTLLLLVSVYVMRSGWLGRQETLAGPIRPQYGPAETLTPTIERPGTPAEVIDGPGVRGLPVVPLRNGPPADERTEKGKSSGDSERSATDGGGGDRAARPITPSVRSLTDLEAPARPEANVSIDPPARGPAASVPAAADASPGNSPAPATLGEVRPLPSTPRDGVVSLDTQNANDATRPPASAVAGGPNAAGATAPGPTAPGATGAATTGAATTGAEPRSTPADLGDGANPGSGRPAEVAPVGPIRRLVVADGAPKTGLDPAEPDARFFISLQDALRAAVDSKDVDTIELRFDGPRTAQPITIALPNRRLTIRAATGRKPTVVFRPAEGDGEPERRMIRVVRSSVTWEQVHLSLELPPDSYGEWALFLLDHPGRIELNESALTIRDGSELGGAAQQAAFFQFTEPMLAETMMDQKTARDNSPPASIALRQCIARGYGAFIRSPTGVPFRLTWHQGLFASTSGLVETHGARVPPQPSEGIAVDLSQMTLAIGRPLCTTRVEPETRFPLELVGKFTNCIFLQANDTGGAGPPLTLVEQQFAAGTEVTRKRPFLSGEGNYYPNEMVILRVAPLDNPAGVIEYSLLNRDEARQEKWYDEQPSVGMVMWKRLPDSERPVDAQTKLDYQLDEAPNNPAARAGFDPTQLPDLGPPVGSGSPPK